MDFSNNNDNDSNGATLFTKYIDWMKAQGATVKDDPDTVRDVLKALLNG